MRFLFHHLDLLVFLAGCATVPVMAVSTWVRHLRAGRRGGAEPRRWVRWLWTALLGVEAGCALYGHFIEPAWLEITRHELRVEGLVDPLRIVHLSDLHLDGSHDFEDETLRAVEEARPDLVMLTGDYLNHRRHVDRLRRYLGRLADIASPQRVFAVTGNFEAVENLGPVFEEAGIALLDGILVTVTCKRAAIQVAGIGFHEPRIAELHLEELASQVAPDVPAVLLHHTPDLAESPGVERFDLVLAGHTHGGQVRLPLYGALITFSRFGKRYESGLFRLAGSTRMQVSRGLGTEPAPAWKVRFLCRPEVTVLDLLPPVGTKGNH